MGRGGGQPDRGASPDRVVGLEAGRFVSLPAQEGVIYVGEMSADDALKRLASDIDEQVKAASK